MSILSFIFESGKRKKQFYFRLHDHFFVSMQVIDEQPVNFQFWKLYLIVCKSSSQMPQTSVRLTLVLD